MLRLPTGDLAISHRFWKCRLPLSISLI